MRCDLKCSRVSLSIYIYTYISAMIRRYLQHGTKILVAIEAYSMLCPRRCPIRRASIGFVARKVSRPKLGPQYFGSCPSFNDALKF